MKMSQKARAYVALVRPPYLFVLDVLCILFIVTFQKGLYDPALIGLAVIAVTFTCSGGAAINDFYDRDSDVVTHPERPLSTNQISPARAVQVTALTFLVALGASFMINPVAFSIVGSNIVLFIIYARIIKRFSGFVSNLLMGYLGATIVLFSGAAVFQTINAASLSFVGLIAGGAIGLNVLKDIFTLEGDLKVGYPTLAAKRGIRVAAIVGSLFLIISVITSPLPFFVGVVSVAYLFPIVVWGVAVVIVSITLLKESNTENVIERLNIFTTYWPYVAGAAAVSYIVPFIIWGA